MLNPRTRQTEQSPRGHWPAGPQARRVSSPRETPQQLAPTRQVQRPTLLPTPVAPDTPEAIPDMPANAGGRGIPAGTRSKRGGISMAYLAPLLAPLLGGLIGKASGSKFSTGAKAGLQFGAGFGTGMVEERRHQETLENADREYMLEQDRYLLDQEKYESDQEHQTHNRMQLYLESYRTALTSGDAKQANVYLSSIKSLAQTMKEKNYGTPELLDQISGLDSDDVTKGIIRGDHKRRYDTIVSGLDQAIEDKDAHSSLVTIDSALENTAFMEYARSRNPEIEDLLTNRRDFLDKRVEIEQGDTSKTRSDWYSKKFADTLSTGMLTSAQKRSLAKSIDKDSRLTDEAKLSAKNELEAAYVKARKIEMMSQLSMYNDPALGLANTPQGEGMLKLIWKNFLTSQNPSLKDKDALEQAGSIVEATKGRLHQDLRLKVFNILPEQIFFNDDMTINSGAIDLLGNIVKQLSPQKPTPRTFVFNSLGVDRELLSGEELESASSRIVNMIRSFDDAGVASDREGALELHNALKHSKAVYDAEGKSFPTDLMEAYDSLGQTLGITAQPSPRGGRGDENMYSNPYRRPSFMGGELTPQGEEVLTTPPPSAPQVNIDADPVTGQIFPQRTAPPPPQEEDEENNNSTGPTVPYSGENFGGI